MQISKSILIPQMFKLFYWTAWVPYYKWIMDTFTLPIYSYDAHGAIYGPYSIWWWGFYYLITRLGYTMFGYLLVLIDTGILIWAKNRLIKPVYATFFTLSTFMFFFSPIDMLIIWIGLFGFKYLPVSLIALLTKLPTGSYLVTHSFYVWNYILIGPLSLTGRSWIDFLSITHGYGRYFIMLFWILTPLTLRLRHVNIWNVNR